MATILENVNALSVHLEDAYTALETKGATIPQQKNATNLSATVDTLPAAGFTIDDLLGTTAKDLVVNVTEIPAGSQSPAGGGGYRLFSLRNTVKTADFPNLVKVNSHSCDAMFASCTSITELKQLPATTLAYSCYSSMFYGCTALTAAPSLPATTLAIFCYSGMFYGCTALTAAPSLPAVTLAQGCCQNMFNSCSNLTGEIVVPVADQEAVPTQVFTNMF